MLRFGINIDRDYIIPYYLKFLYIYGLGIMFVHATVLYLLLFHAKTWARAVRTGYLLNQAQMLAHDIWACFLLRGYSLLPYPIVICFTRICSIIGGYNSYTIENVFMVHGVCALLFMLLVMQQQILPPTSRLILPRRSLFLLMGAVYTLLALNPISAYLTGVDPPNKEEMLNRSELAWTKGVVNEVIIMGDIGNCSVYKYRPLRILVVVSSARFLKKQVVVTSKAMRMKRLIVEVLIKQLAYASIFYIYPLLFQGIFCEFQIAFLPDIALIAVRVAFGVFYLLNSSAQFYVLLKAHKNFRNALRTSAGNILDWTTRRTPNTRSTSIGQTTSGIIVT